MLHNEDPKKLVQLNRKGYGIFFCVNKTDGKGRKASNIVEVRAVFADLDGASTTGPLDDGCHLMVESSDGKYHAYWFVNASRFPLAGFSDVQKGIALKFNSDPSVNDLSRVLRVPGYYHRKGVPYPVNVVYESPDQTKLSYQECVERFPPAKREEWSTPKYTKKDDGCAIDVGISAAQALLKYGWKYCGGKNFTRPGKAAGVSASIQESGNVYIFTSSTPFEPMSSVDAFEIVSQYDFSGDKSRCAKHYLEKR